MNALHQLGTLTARNPKPQSLAGAWDNGRDLGQVKSHGPKHGAMAAQQSLFLVDLGNCGIVNFGGITKGRTYAASVNYDARQQHQPFKAILKSIDVARLVTGSHMMRHKPDPGTKAGAFEASRFSANAASITGTEPRASDVIDEVLGLVSGWDGDGTVAPTSEAKRVTVSVAAHLSDYLSSAEVEVDPSDGGVSFHWHSADQRTLVSVDVRPTGKIIVIGSSVEGNSTRTTLALHEVGRVLRTAVDAGISHLDDQLP